METNTPHQETDERSESNIELATDTRGYVREIISLEEEIKITFRSRDEHLPCFEGTPSHCLTRDEIPHHAIDIESSNDSEANLFIVNATPKGVIDLALKLDPHNAALHQIRNNFENNTLGNPENALLDLMIAGLYESQTEQAHNTPPSVGGLVDVARALNGDRVAIGRLHSQLEVLEKEERLATLRELGEEALDHCLSFETTVSPELAKEAKDIILVRATSFEPEFNEDGEVILRSASDATREVQREENEGSSSLVPRNTVHFSLNHKVRSHLFGNFSDRKYTIIAPLERTLIANGLPTQINGVDTYFTVGPTELLTLPGAHIAEADPDQKELVIRRKNRTVFKSENFGAEHTTAILDACKNGDFSGIADNPAEYMLKQSLLAEATEIGLFSGVGSDRAYYQSLVEKGEFDAWRMTQPLEQSYAQSLDFIELVEYLASRGVPEHIPISRDLFLNGLVQTLVTEGAIAQQGGQVVSGGEVTTGSASFEDSLSNLREILAVSGGGHMGSAEELTESIALGYLSNDHIGGPPRDLNSQLRNPDLPHRMKRALVNEGLISTCMLFQRRDDNEGI